LTNNVEAIYVSLERAIESGIDFKSKNFDMTMTQNNTAINDKIRTFILQETFADTKQLQPESLIFKEGYFDSLGFVKLITYLEDEFGIKLSDADLVEDNFESINAITSFILRKSE
jgi:acyl carrier protein